MKTGLALAAVAALALGALIAAPHPSDAQQSATSDVLARGKYLVAFGGCNDCHTPGYNESGGKLPETKWLVGSPVGFRGPWGTTYPHNLRLSVAKTDAKTWMTWVRDRNTLPPMPWPSLHALDDSDAMAMYAYIKSLGPTGSPAPAALPPGVVPKTPYIDFVPKNLPASAQ